MTMNYFDKLEKFTFSDQELDNIFFSYQVPDTFYQKGYFMEYFVQNGQRPEHVSNQVYKTPKLYWLVLLYNRRIDPFYNWPLDMNELELVAEKEAELQYGAGYTTAQYTAIHDELYLANERLNKILLPHPNGVEEILKDISNYLREQQ